MGKVVETGNHLKPQPTIEFDVRDLARLEGRSLLLRIESREPRAENCRTQAPSLAGWTSAHRRQVPVPTRSAFADHPLDLLDEVQAISEHSRRYAVEVIDVIRTDDCLSVSMQPHGDGATVVAHPHLTVRDPHPPHVRRIDKAKPFDPVGRSECPTFPDVVLMRCDECLDGCIKV